MALISLLSRLVSGIERNVDLSVNTLVVQELKLNGVLLTTTAGSSAIGDAGGYSNFTPTGATVRGALQGIDTALNGSGSTQLDGTFKIENTADPTKILKFDASGITTGTTRTLKMADANVDLANLTNSNISASAAIVYSKLSLANSIVNADIAAGAAIAYAKLALSNSIVNADIAAAAAIAYNKLATLGGSTNAVLVQSGSGFVTPSSILSGNLFLADGTVAMTAALNHGGFKGTNAADPTAPQDLVTKFYADNLVAGLSWKTYARAGSVANVNIASAPASIDGVTLAAGNRVLLKDQTTASQNGIYVFSAAASPLTRSTDMDAWSEVVGAVLLVTEGTVNAGSKWVNQNVDGGTLGTTAISFTAFSIAGTVNGTGTSGYVAYWNGTASLTAEQFLSTVRGGLGVDASGFTGILHFVAGVATASAIVNADVAAGAGIVYSKLSLTNSIVNADIAAGAAIVYSKLSLSNSIVNADIAAGAAIAYSKLALTNSIVLGDLTANSVDENKIVSTALDQKTLLGGSGTKLNVAYAPLVKKTLVAGEAFAANTSFIVRWALTGETAGRVYKADKDASSVNKYAGIGIMLSTSAISAGQNIDVVLHGSAPQGTSDSAYSGADVGKELFVGTTGAIILGSALANTTNEAAFCIGVIQDTTTVWVDFKQLRGIA